MENFRLYFSWGWTHIISWDAMDHLLFLLALTAIYTYQDRKQLLILITAFTIGHSLTLALSVANCIDVNKAWVEFLIPVTIIGAGVFNLIWLDQKTWLKSGKYLLTMAFGLIHGLGFASVIQMTLMETDQVFIPLLYFNLGIEVGQLAVVMLMVLISEMAIRHIGISKINWVRLLSGAAIVGGLYFAIDRSPF